MKRTAQRTVGWLMILVILPALVCTGSAEEDFSPFLTITADRTDVYAEARAKDSVCTLQKGRLCGLIAEVTTADGAWYSIVCLDEGRNGCLGYIPKHSARRLPVTEFNALMEDAERANEVMDLISMISSISAGPDGNGAVAGGMGSSAGMETVQELYDNAMRALSSFSGDLTSGLAEVEKMQGELLEKAVDTGADLIGAAISGISEQTEKVTAALEDAAQAVSGKVAELTGEASDLLAGIYDTYLPMVDSAVQDLADGYGEDFFEEAGTVLSTVKRVLSVFGDE